MTAALEKVVPMLADLSAEDRDELMDILDGLNGEKDLSPEEWEKAWDAECERRSEDMKSGRSPGKPAAEVMALLREKPS